MLEVEPQIIENYVRSGEVRIVYRHLLQLGEKSEQLAELSECAVAQNQFWELRAAFYTNLSDLYLETDTRGLAIAESIGLDPEPLSACLADGEFRDFVRADYAAAQTEGVRSRPVFRLDDQLVVGTRQYPTFQQLFEQVLEDAE